MLERRPGEISRSWLSRWFVPTQSWKHSYLLRNAPNGLNWCRCILMPHRHTLIVRQTDIHTLSHRLRTCPRHHMRSTTQQTYRFISVRFNKLPPKVIKCFIYYFLIRLFSSYLFTDCFRKKINTDLASFTNPSQSNQVIYLLSQGLNMKTALSCFASKECVYTSNK